VKLTYKDGVMSFDLDGFLSHLSNDDKLNLAEFLACENVVIAHVVAQILDGCTEGGSYGAKGCYAPTDPAPCTGLDWAIRQVSLRSGFVAAKEILRLQETLAAKEKQLAELQALQGHAFRQRIGNFSE
jgi:hypothetical protein